MEMFVFFFEVIDINGHGPYQYDEKKKKQVDIDGKLLAYA